MSVIPAFTGQQNVGAKGGGVRYGYTPYEIKKKIVKKRQKRKEVRERRRKMQYFLNPVNDDALLFNFFYYVCSQNTLHKLDIKH